MLRTAIGLTVMLGVAAAAQVPNNKRETWQESAKEMGLGPCPAPVRTEAGIDSTEDWRIYADNGFRYCVPAWWTTLRPQPKHPDRIEWKDGEATKAEPWEGMQILVTGRLTVPLARMYPVSYPEGTRRGMWMGLIGGVKAETWGSKNHVTALFRNNELMISGGSRNRDTAEKQRKVVKSVRFTGTSLGGGP